ncbi:MAG: hypothetical protein ABI156_02500, partial [Caldimonas sp.]
MSVIAGLSAVNGCAHPALHRHRDASLRNEASVPLALTRPLQLVDPALRSPVDECALDDVGM